MKHSLMCTLVESAPRDGSKMPSHESFLSALSCPVALNFWNPRGNTALSPIRWTQYPNNCCHRFWQPPGSQIIPLAMSDNSSQSYWFVSDTDSSTDGEAGLLARYDIVVSTPSLSKGSSADSSCRHSIPRTKQLIV